MVWDIVKKFLLTRVINLMDRPDHGEEWVGLLEKCDDGQLLGTCIAIDVLSGSIEPEMFATIINLINLPTDDARREFGIIVNSEPECSRFVCSSRLHSRPMKGDSYIRVLELGDFIEFYHKRGYTRSPSSVERIRAMYFDGKEGVRLSGIREWWRGRLPNVWVTSFKDLEAIINSPALGKTANKVYDALGLVIRNGVGDGNRPELVGVKYPAEFSVGCVQPTTLDSWWIDPGSYYISFGDVDSWGRTHSLTGTCIPQRERVHSQFRNLTEGYQTYYIGVVERPVEQREKLLEEAYRRFIAVLAASGTIS